ncbi:MAG: alpha/beta hydrolase [Acidimicrobiia bacterium]|nr:alpha/beta hydrolase [Acidimicrobiia bacterium]MDH3396765.1 alpha/beta hydrolase [Acidimicrobiia bacterium]MDH5615983.1 alpha/beta hydrolase [Acidimicrobiia bacterium]
MLKSFAGGTIFGERFGGGPLRVLALHGWGRDRRDFDEILGGLDAAAIDLPGFGASPEPPEAVGAAGYARLIAPVLDEFPQPAIIVGHSFGGRVAVHLAVLRPEKVGTLILMGAPLLRPAGSGRGTPPFAYRMIRAMHRKRWIGDDRMELARQRYGSADYRAARGVMREVLVVAVNESYEAQLDQIHQPVQLIWGADDRDVPVEIARRAMEHLSRAELTLLEGVGHHVCLESPAAVRAAVLGGVS